jgi:hypothetical protein
MHYRPQTHLAKVVDFDLWHVGWQKRVVSCPHDAKGRRQVVIFHGRVVVVADGQVMCCADQEVVGHAQVLVVVHDGGQVAGKQGDGGGAASVAPNPAALQQHVQRLQHVRRVGRVVIRVGREVTSFNSAQEPV